MPWLKPPNRKITHAKRMEIMQMAYFWPGQSRLQLSVISQPITSFRQRHGRFLLSLFGYGPADRAIFLKFSRGTYYFCSSSKNIFKNNSQSSYHKKSHITN
jgi:hypothetical protein